VFQREARFALTAEAVEKLAHPPAEERRLPMPEDIVAIVKPMADGQERDLPAFKQYLSGSLNEEQMRSHFEPITYAAATEASPKHGSIATTFGGIIVVGGFLATLLATWLGEKVKWRGAYFWVIGLGALFALPSFIAFLYLPLPWGWLAAFLAIVGMFMHVGPGNTILANVVTSEMRATAFAINILVIHALGDVISPPLIGLVADKSNLHTAFLATSAMILVSGLLWCYGSRYLDEDTAKAS
jgi:predicted MFS family arabinose efflux permease